MEIPSFQTQIYDSTVYQDKVEVVALTENYPSGWLEYYKYDVENYKDMIITFPMVNDSTGMTFEDYEAGGNLPSIFLIDQIGTIQYRSDGTSQAAPFLAEFEEEILPAIDYLLANPPNGP